MSRQYQQEMGITLGADTSEVGSGMQTLSGNVKVQGALKNGSKGSGKSYGVSGEAGYGVRGDDSRRESATVNTLGDSAFLKEAALDALEARDAYIAGGVSPNAASRLAAEEYQNAIRHYVEDQARVGDMASEYQGKELRDPSNWERIRNGIDDLGDQASDTAQNAYYGAVDGAQEKWNKITDRFSDD